MEAKEVTFYVATFNVPRPGGYVDTRHNIIADSFEQALEIARVIPNCPVDKLTAITATPKNANSRYFMAGGSN